MLQVIVGTNLTITNYLCMLWLWIQCNINFYRHIVNNFTFWGILDIFITIVNSLFTKIGTDNF